MPILKVGDDPVEAALSQANRAVHAQGTSDRPGFVPSLVDCGVDGGEGAIGGFVETQPHGCRPDGAGVSLQQPGSRMGFEIAKELAHRRLRDPEILGGRRHRTALHGANEGSEGDGEIHA